MVALKNTSLNNSYSKLLNDIKEIIVSGQKEVELKKAITYWKVGELINKNILKNKNRAQYGKKLFLQLSKDIQINERTLQAIVKFNQKFPIPNVRSQFNWTKYRALLSVDNKKKRASLLSKAKKQNLNSLQLEAEVKKLNTATTNKKISVEKGVLGLGQIIAIPTSFADKKKAGYSLIDLGFKINHFSTIPTDFFCLS